MRRAFGGLEILCFGADGSTPVPLPPLSCGWLMTHARTQQTAPEYLGADRRLWAVCRTEVVPNADTPDARLDLVDRHRDPSAFARAATLAWTQAQLQLRHLGITHADATDFQSLGGMLIRNDARLRA